MKVTLLAAVAFAAILLVYGDTIGFGFRYDDYHVLRPATRAELLSVAHGNWDPTGIESTFYRPLTAWWYALRFSLFGIDAVPPHVLSVAGSALCAFFAGLFVWRETRRLIPSLAASAIYAAYPAFVYAQAIWLTNQMHLFASLTVLSALLLWQRARRRGGAAWWWLIAMQVVAFGFKEDTIMLLPAIAVLTGLRMWMARDVRLPDWRVAAAAIVVVALLPYWRYVALGRHLGGYGRPGFDRGWANLTRIIDLFVERPAKRPWQAVAGWYSGLVLAAGAAAALAARRISRLHLLLSGVTIALAFNLPFYLVSKAEQYHLVALGCVIAIAGAIDAIRLSLPSRAGAALATIAMVPALSFYPVTRNIAQDFAPCSPGTLYTDAIAAGWYVVPHEIRGWLNSKPAACNDGTLRPLHEAVRSVVWAHGREADETGAPVEWTADRATILLAPDLSRADITLRTPIASPQSPSTVVIETGSWSYRMLLTDTAWHSQTMRLTPTLSSRLSGMFRIDLTVTPTFVPAERFKNGDTRVLGVLLKILW